MRCLSPDESGIEIEEDARRHFAITFPAKLPSAHPAQTLEVNLWATSFPWHKITNKSFRVAPTPTASGVTEGVVELLKGAALGPGYTQAFTICIQVGYKLY